MSQLTLWLVDTRAIWSGTDITIAAANALAVLPQQDQVAVRRKHFIQDARMSLASALLKRLWVSQTLGIPWNEVSIARRGDPTHGKPAALLKDGTFAPIDFNVSHQGGLVTLVGFAPSTVTSTSGTAGSLPDVLVGTDITLVNERNDYASIDADGFDEFVDVFSEVFGEAERFDIKYNVDYLTMLDGRVIPGTVLGRADRSLRRGERFVIPLSSLEGLDDFANDTDPIEYDSELIVEAKLRRFYSFFAYKEAYIKLEGEALLAPWLRELEFHNVRSPKPGVRPKCSGNGIWGERVDDVDVQLRGRKVEDVQMDIRSYDEGFQIATAIKGRAEVNLCDVQYRVLDLERETYSSTRRRAPEDNNG